MILLSIPEPCRQNWNEMASCEQGAFCKTCSETVVDFTKLSDEEIKNYFLLHPEKKICGRFRNHQLSDSENLLPKLLSSSIPLWKKFLAAVFILFSGFLTGCMGKVQVSVPSKEIQKHKSHITAQQKVSTPTFDDIQK
jgi:hypothetical protein